IEESTRRIEAMRHDRNAFHNAVAAVAATLPGAPSGDAVETCRRLEHRLQAARNEEAELKNLKDQLKPQMGARDRATDKLRRSSAALDTLCAGAGCARADELSEIERKSTEKQSAVAARGKIETRVREDGDGRDFVALFGECEDVLADQIPADILSLETD